MINGGYIAVSLRYVSELIANNNTQFMEFGNPDRPAVRDVSMRRDEQVFDGSTRWRFEVRSKAPYTSNARGDTFLEVYEIFSKDTMAQLYGMTGGYRPVLANTVYYTQVLDTSTWSMDANTTGISIQNGWILDARPNTIQAVFYNATTLILGETVSPRLNMNSTASLRPVIDGSARPVNSWSGRIIPLQSNGDYTVYESTVTMPKPTRLLALQYEFRIFPNKTYAKSAPKSSDDMPRWKQNAIGVALGFGFPALCLVIGFAVWFFCLGCWLPIWRVISRPGRAVYRKAYDWRRPPAPRFRSDDDDEEDEDEMDGLNSERVGADEILRMTGGAVGNAAAAGKLSKEHGRQTSQDNVLIRLRKAMGRRLSNFVGWDGPPGMEASGSEKSGGKHKKGSKRQSQHSGVGIDSSHDVEESDIEASSASYYAQPSTTHEATGFLHGNDSDDAASSSHLMLGYSSAEDDAEAQTGQYSPISSPSSSRPETPVRMRPDARTEETSPSRAKKGAAHGLRGFKITSSPMTSIDHPSPPPSAHPDSSVPPQSPTGSDSMPGSPVPEDRA